MALSAIRDTINPTRGDGRRLTTVLAGDFNRHHPTWGGNHILPRFSEDADDLINFFQAQGLQVCLPRGTATFWSLSHPGRASTVDQTVTNSPDLMIKFHLYHENYGSDHRATLSEWNIRPRRNPSRTVKKAYDRADWDKIGREVQQKIEPWPEENTPGTLDHIVGRLIDATTTTGVQRHP